jgi:hypothetical protein
MLHPQIFIVYATEMGHSMLRIILYLENKGNNLYYRFQNFQTNPAITKGHNYFLQICIYCSTFENYHYICDIQLNKQNLRRDSLSEFLKASEDKLRSVLEKNQNSKITSRTVICSFIFFFQKPSE